MPSVITELPLYEERIYKYTTNLEGLSFEFQFYWNDRATQWHMDIRSDDRSPVLLGKAIVPQFPMCANYVLEDYGLSGYFVLLPESTRSVNKITENRQSMPQFFKLYYIYQTEGVTQ